MADVNPILVGIELSGNFVAVIIDLMDKYPEEWKFTDGANLNNQIINHKPLVEHESGVKLAINYGEQNVRYDEAVWEASIYSPVYIPSDQNCRKKLGAACDRLARILILKSLKFERLLEKE